jgi:peptidoglycan/LPS O-acetylase OafA/YrhL
MPMWAAFRRGPGDDRTRGLPQLTALRFVAAALVLASHLTFLGAHTWPAVRWFFDEFLFRGYVGVSFFYVLSGFVVGLAYERQLLGGAMSRAHYLALRLARMLPLHWLVTAPLLCWVLIKDQQPPLSTIVLNLALLQTWVADIEVYFSLNGPSWSLSNEIFFSMLLPWLVLLRTRILAQGIAAGASAVAFLALASLTPVGAHWLPVRLHQFLFEINPVVRSLEFATGLLLLRLYLSRRGEWRASTGTELAALAAWPLLMLGLSLSGLPSQFHQLVTLPFMALVVYVMACGGGAVTRFLSAPVMVLLGDASFALYMTHLLVVNFMEVVAGKLGHAQPGLLFAGGLALFCVLFSILVHRVLERPLHYWLKDRLDHHFRARSKGWPVVGSADTTSG